VDPNSEWRTTAFSVRPQQRDLDRWRSACCGRFTSSRSVEALVRMMYSTTLSLAHFADGRIAGILHLGPPEWCEPGPFPLLPVASLRVKRVRLSWVLKRANLGTY
jgi:hypothetical protein